MIEHESFKAEHGIKLSLSDLVAAKGAISEIEAGMCLRFSILEIFQICTGSRQLGSTP